MFFFEDDKTKIEFETSIRAKKNFEKALEILGKSKEEAFDEFLTMLITQALNASDESSMARPQVSYNNLAHIIPNNSVLTEDTIRSRIVRWARNVDTNPHKVMKAYFLTIDSNLNYTDAEYKAYRPKMEAHFNYLIGESGRTISTFIIMFRQMSSNAVRAYGDVFKFDRNTKEVTINEKYRELVFSLKDQFLE